VLQASAIVGKRVKVSKSEEGVDRIVDSLIILDVLALQRTLFFPQDYYY
jgi:hypothetical protein